jgi:hypothetical protein
MPTKPDTTEPDTTNDDSGPQDGVCGVCGHPLSAHDAISVRYCAATAAGALTRGCVCPHP